MSIAKKVVGLLPAGGNGTAQPAETDDEESSESAGLYECQACNVTYISDSMDDCPNCRDAVDQVPSERDLGMI